MMTALAVRIRQSSLLRSARYRMLIAIPLDISNKTICLVLLHTEREFSLRYKSASKEARLHMRILRTSSPTPAIAVSTSNTILLLAHYDFQVHHVRI
ncbi:MAG: hypothetical protein [Circoviridae sp.]|nr:MAG: hypothetical protein [Circoviridae sp.]